jgi:hypothetical protein
MMRWLRFERVDAPEVAQQRDLTGERKKKIKTSKI